MPSYTPKYLNFGCRNMARCGKEGSCPKYGKWGDSWECAFANLLNAAVVYGSSWSHSEIPLIGNLHTQSLRHWCDSSIFPFNWGWQEEISWSWHRKKLWLSGTPFMWLVTSVNCW